ncbi:gpW family head-tail joining protein [Pararoseomonas indoligenes]|uniref:Phage head-tail adapter protein n=1 Tax=Roseomonas indoligenes TaxID=2820811 RepID=A0A940S799_9PROT|nr:gpW family head-tail joining protein [Pararoseomonas indoligenes]MBP0492867.1 phage head-tail adapter protein [Pararoseomonas indoligenes]
MSDTIQVGAFAGMSRAALEGYRTRLQEALLAFGLGEKTVAVSYTQGTGSRSVTFTPTDDEKIRGIIRQLNAALGVGRRAQRVVFR